ncbi:peptidylprolyl isomerase [Tuwongella immobilis]|uniref:PPIase cyclophilin-type domain-containing protein n=1 Tax=Tuwongella immobilis TaxID=692036 RepID=A0A6C2YK93_9BACT|nr:peptidylprolyl isomerase [Tuwongella immobilis]VIP01797.1 glycoside hydrolase : Uncharacterized protein OS=Pirellula staleyi (strain ATCC 27377 / DSM 6068 / ICPB 4128) GN=Psta_2516 PE=4 SV=1: Pro_isomerase [Tuwongella immobilis]VTR99480.1 glycoside hydrolase : Uncharacterized protein OS=Pirellula staleyi (strain ATCC 27377 / DSM 6068 / ICPB 4128) GN=Psta_2516 PE=4 SV=1: Pro_isomerase [Tuwongella immobilis]
MFVWQFVYGFTRLTRGIGPRRLRILVALLMLGTTPRLLAENPSATVSIPGPVSEELRREWKLPAFYQRHCDADGLPILGSAKVSDNALAEAGYIVRQMLEGRADIRQAMIRQRVRAVIMASSEYTTDVPEHARLKPKVYWDRRARGLGATPAVPAVSGGEENLLQYPRDPYSNENIFLHEFAHAIHETGMNRVDPTFDGRLQQAFRASLDRGLWKNTYAATNRQEYWAEGVQCWFDANAPKDELHNEIRTRDQLKRYDPTLAALCKEVFGDRPWRYVPPKLRPAADRAHLKDYDPAKLPRFRWREEPIGTAPRVTVQTAVGDFDVELAPEAAPNAVAQFLSIALDGGYHSGQFRRVGNSGIGATPNPTWQQQWARELPPVRIVVPAVKPTIQSGTVALVQRDGAWLGWVIALEDDASLPDAEIVPIGRVVIPTGQSGAGRVVTAIGKQLPADGQPEKPVGIRRVIRMN